MKSITTEVIAELLQHYSALVITGKEKSGRSLIAIDILKEKIKTNNKLQFTIFNSTSEHVYRNHFQDALIFDGDNLDELLKIQKKTTHKNDDTSYVLILDDCGRKMFEQINAIVSVGSNYNIYVILIPSPIHMECIDWDTHKFDYIIKANKEHSTFETNKKCIENSNIKNNKKPDFTIEQLQEKENIPTKETILKYSYKVRPELLEKNNMFIDFLDKLTLSF